VSVVQILCDPWGIWDTRDNCWAHIAKPMPKPIMDDCDECYGEGQVQQRCEDCRIALDDDNLAVGAESYVCKTCFAQENGA
jgi:hypothetical protein